MEKYGKIHNFLLRFPYNGYIIILNVLLNIRSLLEKVKELYEYVVQS